MENTATVTADEKAYQDLVMEFGDEASPPQDQTPPPQEPVKTEPTAEKPVEEPKKAPPDYDELNKRYTNLQGALGESRGETRELKQRYANLETVVRQLVGQRERGQPPAEEQNPLEPLLREIEDLRGKTQAFERHTAEQREMADLNNYAIAAERQFMATAPDYTDAVNHLANARMAELAVFFPDHSLHAQDAARQRGLPSVADLRAAILRDEQIGIAKQAKAFNMNPAEVMYGLAKQRGFAGKQPAAQAQEAPVSPPAKPSIEGVRRGQEAAGTLNGGGSPPAASEDTMSVEDLAQLYIDDPAKADAMFERMKARGLFN